MVLFPPGPGLAVNFPVGEDEVKYNRKRRIQCGVIILRIIDKFFKTYYDPFCAKWLTKNFLMSIIINITKKL